MMIPPQPRKHYASAAQRFLTASIESFFERELPRYFGPIVRRRLAEEVTRLVEQQLPARRYLRPGQCVWNAVSKQTRPDSVGRKLVPVVLTLIDASDVENLAQGQPMSQVASASVARLCLEAFQQGALLSMRDIGLLVWRQNSSISTLRKNWEQTTGQLLPHPGSLHDFGSCISHKSQIVRQAILEKKDPRRVARDTRHSQKAVDHYLKDFHRVRTAWEQYPNLEFVCQTTGLSRRLVTEYLQLIKQTEKNS